MRFFFNMFEYIFLPSLLSIFFLHIFNMVSFSHNSRQFRTGVWTLRPAVFCAHLHYRTDPVALFPLFSFLLPVLLALQLIPSCLFLFFPSPLLFFIYHSLLYKDEAGYRLSCIKASNLMYRELNKSYISQFVTHYYYYKAPFCILSFFLSVCLLFTSPLIFHPQLTLICLIYDHGCICVLEKYTVILFIQVILIYSNGVIFWIQFYFLYFFIQHYF